MRKPAYSPRELERAQGRATGAALVDLRAAAAYRRSHLRGSVNIPAPLLLRSLFLLPQRGRPLILLGRDGRCAEAWAGRLAQRGWTRVGWLNGSPRELDARLHAAGAAPNRIWEPAPILRRFSSRLPLDGAVCDLACGSGRNAAFLALGGREVLGVDRLPDALRQARALARAARIPLPGRTAFRLLDLADPRAAATLLRPGRFRVLTCFRYLDRDLLPRIASALAPGSWLIYETFLEEQAREGRKPNRPAFLLKPGELRRAFSSLEVIHWREGRDPEGDWLATLVGRMPS